MTAATGGDRERRDADAARPDRRGTSPPGRGRRSRRPPRSRGRASSARARRTPRRRRAARSRSAARAAARTTRSQISSRIVPTVPEKMCPGTMSSSTINASPSQKKMNARFGSNSACRNATTPHGSSARATQSVGTERHRRAVADLDVPPSTLGQQRLRSGSRSRSITPASRASSAVMLVASRTNVARPDRRCVRSCSAMLRM